MKEVDAEEQGRKLLTAVERILADTDSLVTLAQQYVKRARALNLPTEQETRHAAAESVVRHYSNLSAVSGGVSALPATLFPGAGGVATATGGALADMCLMLKFEVEMALVLSKVYGFDITREDERKRAFLLASVSTYDAQRREGSILGDIAEAEGVALWNYGPRELTKLLVGVLARLALLSAGKGLVRALPLVGVVVGSSMNKLLTRSVGTRCREELQKRRSQLEAQTPPPDDVVDANVRDS